MNLRWKKNKSNQNVNLMDISGKKNDSYVKRKCTRENYSSERYKYVIKIFENRIFIMDRNVQRTKNLVGMKVNIS